MGRLLTVCRAATGALLGLLVLGVAWVPAHAAQPAVPPVPALQGRINDLAHLLDASSAARLERKLQAYEQQSGNQFAVLIVPTLGGDPVDDYAVRVFEAWELGKAKKDTGLLLLIVPEPQHRAVRIEVGYGLEGTVTDALSKRVITQILAPAFRRQDYAGGIDAATSALMVAASGKEPLLDDAPAAAGAAADLGPTWPWIIFLLLFFGPTFLLPLLFGGGPGGRGGGGFGGGFGGGMGGGGWSGGGGGFSGGGGSSGGGGASGSW
jgi:uncharacterized protein